MEWKASNTHTDQSYKQGLGTGRDHWKGTRGQLVLCSNLIYALGYSFWSENSKGKMICLLMAVKSEFYFSHFWWLVQWKDFFQVMHAVLLFVLLAWRSINTVRVAMVARFYYKAYLVAWCWHCFGVHRNGCFMFCGYATCILGFKRIRQRELWRIQNTRHNTI